MTFFLCRLGREEKGILTFKKQLSIVDQLVRGMRLGAGRRNSYIRSPRAFRLMKHSDNARIFRKVAKAHLQLSEKRWSL